MSDPHRTWRGCTCRFIRTCLLHTIVLPVEMYSRVPSACHACGFSVARICVDRHCCLLLPLSCAVLSSCCLCCASSAPCCAVLWLQCPCQMCGGTVLRCLTEHRDEIKSESCRKEVFYFEKMEVSNFHNDVILAAQCRGDVDKFCKDVPPGGCSCVRVWGVGVHARGRMRACVYCFGGLSSFIRSGLPHMECTGGVGRKGLFATSRCPALASSP
jgi:hypothetical protein